MQNHVAVVHDQPAVAGLAFFAAFLPVLHPDAVQNSISQRIEHAVAGAVADDKIVCQACDVFEFKQQDVFALFFFQGVDNGAGQFKCVQMSPRCRKRVTLSAAKSPS